MNGFSAADMSTAAANGFRDGLAAQTAAAQEAVAYLDIGAGGYLDIGSDLSDEQLLALPKGRHALAIIGTFGIDGYVAASPTVTDPVAAYERELAAGATHEHALHAICTPAAPGIDLYPIRCALQYAAAAARENTHTEMAEGFDALIRKIDASPKGSLNEQFGSAEGLDSPKGGSDPLQVPDTEGVREILGRMCFRCIRLAQVLRLRGDDIKSRAEDEQAAVLRFLLNHYLASPDKWAERAQAEIDAIRAKARAGDAEVQP